MTPGRSEADIAFEMFLATTTRESMSPYEQRLYDFHLGAGGHPDRIDEQAIADRARTEKNNQQRRWRAKRQEKRTA